MSNQRPLPLHEDNSGVSTVLGAILVAALTIMLMVSIRVNFVPQWDADDDSDRINELGDSMAQLRASLDRQLDDPTATAVTVPISLSGGSSQSGLFASTRLASTLNFMGSSPEALNLTADQLVVRLTKQVQLEAVDENWQSVTTDGTLFDVVDVQHLRLRLTNPESGADGDGILLTVTDVDGNFAGSLEYYVEDMSSAYGQFSRVTNADGTVIYDGGEVSSHKYTPTYVWLDALNPSIFFTHVLAAADGPISLSMTQTGLVGNYAISYLEATPGGPVQIAGSGKTINNYVSALAGGALALEFRPTELPAQTFVYEHGAVFRVQDDGAATYIKPNMRFVAATGKDYFELDLPMLTGSADSRTGGAVPSQFVVASRSTIDGQANTFTATIATSYPLLWMDLLLDAAIEGGVPPADYSLATGPGTVTLTIDGPSADPADLDVSVKIRQASIKTTFQS